MQYDSAAVFWFEKYPDHVIQWLFGMDVKPIKLLSRRLTGVQPPEVDGLALLNIEGERVIGHIEFLSHMDAQLSRRMLRWASIAHLQHALPIISVAVLLHPRAETKETSGKDVVEYSFDAMGMQVMRFRYRVARAWELDARWVMGRYHIGLIPFLFCGLEGLDEAMGLVKEVRGIAPKLKERIMELRKDVLMGRYEGEDIDAEVREVSERDVQDMWACIAIMLGLNFDAMTILSMVGDELMRESSVYQWLVERGRREGLQQGRQAMRDVLIEMARRQFGEIPRELIERVEAIEEVERLKEITLQVPQLSSLDELIRLVRDSQAL